MNLEDIKNALTDKVKNKTLSLTKPVLDSIGIDGVLRSALNGEDLVFKNVTISGTDKVVIQGESDVFGIGVSGQLEISNKKNDLVLGFNASTGPTENLQIPGLSWFKVSDLNVALTAFPATKKADGKFSGVVTFGKLILPVEISLPLESGKLYLESVIENISVPSVADLRNSLSQASLLDYLPSGLDLSGISLSELGVLFDPQKSAVSYFSIGLNCPGPWNIVSKKALVNNFKISITVGNPVASDRFINVACSADFVVGDLTIPVSLERDGQDKSWTLSTPPSTPVSLPSFSDLANLAIGKDFALPDSLQKLKKPDLSDLIVVFDETKKTFRKFGFNLKLQQSWDLISGKIALADPWISFSSETEDKGQRTNKASIGGNFQLGDTPLPLVATNSGDGTGWRFSGDFKNPIPVPDFNSILKYLGASTFAESLPESLDTLAGMSLSNLALPLDPDTHIPGSITLNVGYQKAWKLPNLDSLSVSGLSANITLFLGGDNGKGITGDLGGTLNLGSVPVILYAVKSGLKSEWVFSANPPKDTEIGLRDLAAVFAAKASSIPKEIPDLRFTAISLSISSKKTQFTIAAKAGSTWELPLGVGGLTLEKIQFNATKETKKPISVSLDTRVSLGGVELGLDYEIPGDLVFEAKIPSIQLSGLLQDVCGEELFRELPLPSVVSSLGLTDVVFTTNATEKFVSLSGNSGLGGVQMKIQKSGGKTGKWGFTCEFDPPKDFKPSSIGSELKFLDKLSLSDFNLVMSSVQIPKYQLEGEAQKSETVPVAKGFNLVTRLDLSGLGADKILEKSSLLVHAAISTSLANTVLEAQLAGSVQLSKTVSFGNMTFRLYPSPKNFGLQLVGELDVELDSSSLQFFGSMEITTLEAELAATMKGDWIDPFGVRRVIISNVALELGVTYEPLLPVVGIAGGLVIGDFTGSAAVKIDPVHPDQCMLAVAFNRLFLMDVMKAFCGPSVVSSIPKSLTTTVLDIGFEDVKVYIVPSETKIGELTFEKGITLQGRMYFWGLMASAYFNVDESKGVVAHAEVDAIRLLDGAFVMAGAKGAKKALLDLALQVGKKPNFEVSASIALLGISRDVLIQFSDSGFLLEMDGNLFNLFQCSLVVSGKDFKTGGDFYVKATMKNDLMKYLREKAAQAIQDGAKDAVSKLSDAQKKVKDAQAEVDKLNGTISDMRKTIQAERDRDAGRLRDAQAAVKSAQDKVNTINGTIDSMRATVRKERERDSGRLKSAQDAVNSAQNQVNSIQGKIDGLNRDIDSLKRDIENLKREYNDSHWYEKTYLWAKIGPQIAYKGTQITGLYTAIGTLQASKYTAIGVLEAAKQTLRGMQSAADNIPVDADPRIVPLFGSREVALGSLEAAKLVLKGMEEAAKNIPIDMDPRITSLFTAKATADAALYTATQFLEGLKISVGALADVATFITNFGLGGLVDVKAASFEAHLSLAKGGDVSMMVSVSLMSQKAQDLSFSFNFNDPLSGAKNLAKSLVPALA
jgi:hypothetical protein